MTNPLGVAPVGQVDDQVLTADPGFMRDRPAWPTGPGTGQANCPAASSNALRSPALVTSPQVLFADEPTGALDTSTSRDVLTLLRRLVTDTEQTIIVVTHDPMAAAYADRVIFLADGRIADTLERPTAEATAAMLGRADPGTLAC